MSKEKEIKRFANITEQNIKKLGVQALADRPNVAGKYGQSGLSPAELKAWFDNLAKFIANKINTVQDTLATDEIAQYIKVALEEYDIEHLQDLIDAVIDGRFAERLLMVLPSQTATERKALQSVIYEMNKTFSDKIADIKKTLTDLGYGYTNATVSVEEDGGDVNATVEVIDEDGEKTLAFTFYNFGKAVSDLVLEIDEKIERLEESTKDAIALPLKKGAEENSVVQEGCETVAKNQIALGVNNKTNPEALFQIGNGTKDNPSNAFEVLRDGTLLGAGVPVIVTGTYLGTGEKTKTITFDVTPKVVGIRRNSKSVNSDIYNQFFVNGQTSAYVQFASSQFGEISVSWGDNSITLENSLNNASPVANDSGKEYCYYAIGFAGSSGGSGGGDTSLVTFYIDGQEFTVAQGTTWLDWSMEDGGNYVYPMGNEMASIKNDAPLLDPSGNPVFVDDIIVSGEYGFASTTMVEFEIQDEVADTRYYSVEDGTTWEDWTYTTIDSDTGEQEWSAETDGEGYVLNNFSGGILADMDGNPVMYWDIITSGAYQRTLM